MPTTCVSLKQCPTSTSLFWRLDICFTFAAFFFLKMSFLFGWWDMNCEYVLHCHSKWSLLNPSHSLWTGDKRNEGVETWILLFLKGRRLYFFVIGGRFFLHLFFLFRYSTFTKVTLFTICLSKSYLCLVSWTTEQNKPILVWHGLTTTSPETVQCISMPYKVYFCRPLTALLVRSSLLQTTRPHCRSAPPGK